MNIEPGKLVKNVGFLLEMSFSQTFCCFDICFNICSIFVSIFVQYLFQIFAYIWFMKLKFMLQYVRAFSVLEQQQ